MEAHEIANALSGARQAGVGWVASCPVPTHGKGRGDRNPSLSIADGANGAPVLHCHAGCPQDSVIAALRAKGVWPTNGTRVAPAAQERVSDGWRPISPVPGDAPKPLPHARLGTTSTSWTYRDERGRLLGYACRFDQADEAKQILPLIYCERDGRREWRWQAFPTPRPLYNLADLGDRPDADVLVVEGEKAADAAAKLLPEHVASTSPGGCKAAAKADWAPLKGREVIVWPDADEPGRAYAAEVARLCRSVGAASVRIIDPPDGVATGWDAADALAEGWDRERASALVEAATAADDASTGTGLRVDTIGDFLALEIPPRELILEPFLPSQGLAMMFAKRGIGKTYLSLGIA